MCQLPAREKLITWDMTFSLTPHIRQIWAPSDFHIFRNLNHLMMIKWLQDTVIYGVSPFLDHCDVDSTTVEFLQLKHVGASVLTSRWLFC